jgi:hypothetical protein
VRNERAVTAGGERNELRNKRAAGLDLDSFAVPGPVLDRINSVQFLFNSFSSFFVRNHYVSRNHHIAAWPRMAVRRIPQNQQ